MPLNKSIKLNTGADMPIIGLGTWKSPPGQVSHAVEVAVKAGYRHIDTATAYGNEKEVGDGLKTGLKAIGLQRKDIFLTTKLNNDDHADPLAALLHSLQSLQTDYLDLWLMHWPAPMTKGCKGADKSIDWLDTWKKMEDIIKSRPDKVKAIGVSNFYGSILQRLLDNATIMPAINQIEIHPGCNASEAIETCLKRGIHITAYSPLGSDASKLHENPVVAEIAKKHGVAPANILISLQANKGISVIPKSVTEKRIVDNLGLVDLSEDEVTKLDGIHHTTTFRVCKPEWAGWGHLSFPA